MSKLSIKKLLDEINELALKKGLSKSELSRLLGVPYSTLREWYLEEPKRRTPSRTSVSKLRAFLRSQKESDSARDQKPPKMILDKPALKAGVGALPQTTVDIRDIIRRAEKVKSILLLLEDELRWFRDGDEFCRKIFRDNVDPDDAGYLSSLLTMLGEEGKFERWSALTTNRFNYFKKRRRKA